jgi:ubiquinone biosynthesis protein
MILSNLIKIATPEGTMRIWISFRRFRRYRQIINVFIKHGFSGLIETLRLRRIFRRRKREVSVSQSPRAKRLRLAFEELGPTFIKMGQMLSNRPDIVPEDIFQELQKLQDQIPPVPAEDIIPEIESQMKAPIDAIFDDFDKTPLATASIGQVYKARMKNGRQVAIKIQRPNVKKTIEEDIDILETIANLAERHLPEADLYDPVGVVDEFARHIRQELDYMLEGRNMERFARNFATDDTLYIPEVFWNLTGSRVLTMELLDGIKISNLEKLRETGFNLKRIAAKIANMYLKQILIDEFFHGDPHPGNIYVLKGEVIGLMDFGIVGRLSPSLSSHLGNLLIAVVRRDRAEIIEEILRINRVEEENIDTENLRADIADFISRYYDIPLSQFNVSEMVRDLSEISGKYRIRMNRQLILLGKVLAQLEGIGRQLDPEFNVVPFIEPFAQRLIAQRLSPKNILSRSSKIIKDYAEFIASLPKDLQTALEKAKSGKLRIEFKHIGIESIVPELERSTSRLSFAMIIAALVVGSALIMQTEPAIGPTILEIPVIGALGYIIAAIFGFWLLVTIIRNRSI